MKKLVEERSRYSEVLEDLGRVVPEKVWLEKFVSKPQAGSVLNSKKENIVLISGWAFDEESVAFFIARLENSPYFSNVQLISTKVVSAKEIWQRTRLKKIPLINFNISTNLSQ